MMKELEKARRNLHIMMDRGCREGILAASQHLDKLILQHASPQNKNPKRL